MKRWVAAATNPRRVKGSLGAAEIQPAEAAPPVRVLLDSRARPVNDEMKLAAARALAACVGRDQLSAEYIIPSVFDKRVAPAVAHGVVRAAIETGTAHRRRLDPSPAP